MLGYSPKSVFFLGLLSYTLHLFEKNKTAVISRLHDPVKIPSEN